ncbi:transglutaminase-like cysteine peptidase [Camelimonas abortus]|uniref:transglutaminase-like cysteine peptidase n=1 Tax=Camelimonas abortus TaxID=1017184 RepID=UPI0035EB7548
MSVRSGLFLAAALAVATSQVQATDLKTAGLFSGAGPARAAVVATTLPPVGWAGFCQNYRDECDDALTSPAEVPLNRKTLRDLKAVNDHFNATIIPVTDMEHWGVAERWDYPSDGRGDCEDYVLAKRRMLMDMGYPRQALLVTVVRDNLGEGHAVLTVVTDRGDLVLDNRRSAILPWSRTGYTFVKRQSAVSQNAWVSLGAPQDAVATASR